MKPIVVTKYGWLILSLFVIGLIPDSLYTHIPFRTIVVLYLFGMLFEILSEDLWTYNPIMNKATFMLRDRDVSLIFGLGWIGVLSLGMMFAKVLRDHADFGLYWSLFVGVGVIGTMTEMLYLKLGLWKYNMDQKALNWSLKKMPMIMGVPLSVVQGYFTTQGTLMYVLVYKLCPWMFGFEQPL